jgi:pyruvate dehydrogenase E2 component (dihydrolipoamide acetyltransferase)
MATEILMPALSPTMTEGTLSRWLKKEGETVKSGDVIAEIETDKATMEVEAADEGILGRILVGEGSEGVKVNTPIAILVAAGEAVPSPTAAPPAAPAPIAGPSAPAAAAAAAPAPVAGQRTIASPLARRMARQAGLDLATLTGSGPGGRVVRADVEAALKRATPAPTPQPRAATPSAPSAPRAAGVLSAHRLLPHTAMRKVIARRLGEAKQTVPHFYISTDIEIDALLKLRAELNAVGSRETPPAFKLSVNDMIIKAAGLTLRRLPKVNAAWTEEGIALFDAVDISVAVAIPDGLITPIVREADCKGLVAISTEMKDLAARARAGTLKLEEFQGGGFSISNLGMYGVTEFAAIINPPQAGILAIAAGQQRPVVRAGALTVATVMTATLSVDHRVVDGALAAQWLAAFKHTLENPLDLVL